MDDITQLYPTNINHVVHQLFKYLSFPDKVKISLQDESDLPKLMPSLGKFISREFNLPYNSTLVESCQSLSRQALLDTDDVLLIIIRQFWKRLREVRI
jgi:hypothetical protein